MNVDKSDVVDMAVVEEEVKDVVGEEVEAQVEDRFTIPIHYLVNMTMKIIFLNIRYMIQLNINHFPDINKL